MRERTLVALELPHVFGRPAEALEAVDAALGALRGADLVLLPETALTGYVSPDGDFDLARFAEPLDGPTARALAALARDHRVALVGPLIERTVAGPCNGLLGFDPHGALVLRYHKRHPWYPERWAAPGALPHPLVTLAGLRVTAGICFDVHFLADEAAAELRAAELLLFPSAWVEDEPEEGGADAAAGAVASAAPLASRAPAEERARDDADARSEVRAGSNEEARPDGRSGLLAALARGHGTAVLNANWGRGVPAIAGQGGSRFVDADGRERARAMQTGPLVVSWKPGGVGPLRDD